MATKRLPYGCAVLCTNCGHAAKPEEIKDHKCPKCDEEYTKEKATKTGADA